MSGSVKKFLETNMKAFFFAGRSAAVLNEWRDTPRTLVSLASVCEAQVQENKTRTTTIDFGFKHTF